MEFNPFRYKDASIEHNTQPKGKQMDEVATREKIDETLLAMGESALLMDGFDEALLGFSQRMNKPLLAVYSYEKMVDVLVERDGMDAEEAMEFIDFNCFGWVGKRTPIIVMPLEL